MATTLGTRGGVLNTSGEHDWFKVSLAANTLYSITSTLSTGSFQIYDAAGNAVYRTDSYGHPLGFMPTTSGTFFVDHFNSMSQFQDAGSSPVPYTLTLASVADDYYSNISTSGSVSVGGSASGTIDTAGDVDWFKIDLTANSLYRVSHSLGYFGWLNIMDADGNSLTSGIYADSDSSGNALGFMPKISGTYFIEIYGFGGETGPYTFSVATVADDYANNPATSGVVSVGGSANGVLNAAGEHDWFKVNLNANTLYQIVSSMNSPHLSVFDGNGNSLYRLLDTQGSTLGFMPETTGTYFIDLSALNRETTGTYSLSVTSVNDDFRNNPTTSGVVAVGGTVGGVINVKGEHDWFRVDLVANTLYDITSTLSLEHINMYDASGERAFGYSFHSEGGGFMPSTSGTYFIDVADYSGATGGYTLSAATVPDDYRDNPSTTGNLAVGGTISATLNAGGEHDWFKVTLQADTLYRVSSSSPGNLIVYDAAGMPVESTDSYGAALGFMPAISGVYFIDYFGDDIQTVGPYTLSLTTVTDDFTNNVRTTGSIGPTGGTGGNINGTSGNDTLTGGSGVAIDGLAGIDTVSYSGNYSSITHNANGTWTVGSDTLTSIERLQFANKKIAIDVTDNALETMQFIGVIAPTLLNDLAVRKVILDFFDQAYTLRTLSELAITYDLVPDSNADLAAHAIHNVLPAVTGTDFDALKDACAQYIGGVGQAQFLADVMALNLNINLVGLQQSGMEFA